MKQENFHRLVHQVGRLFPKQAERLPGYISYLPATGRVRFNKNAPTPIVQAFHLLQRHKKGLPPIQKKPKDLPQQITRTILEDYQDFRPYARIKKTAVEWALLIYARLLRERQDFVLTFERFTLRVRHMPAGILAEWFGADGERLLRVEYKEDEQFLADLYFLFSLDRITIDPLLSDQFQDALVDLRLDPTAFLEVTRLSSRGLKSRHITPAVRHLDLRGLPEEPLSRWGKRVFLPAVTPDRLLKIGERVRFRQPFQPRQRRQEGVVARRIHPYLYDIRTPENIVRGIDYSDLEFIERAPTEHKMNLLQFLYRFPLRYAKTEADDIAADYDD